MRPEDNGAGRDIVVVGASAGGVEPLVQLARMLPADFGGSMFVVLHVPPSGSVLPSILSRACALPVTHAEDGQPIQPGRIYVAPPDNHLILKRDGVRVERTPRENGHRPAIDPLFRSAARTFGPRVAGIVLSGSRDDGTAGLSAIKVRGGLTIAQDPADALYPAMPRNAIEYVKPHHVLPLEGIAELVVTLARARPLQPEEEEPMDDDAPMDELPSPKVAAEEEGPPGDPSGFSCPECGGVLFKEPLGEDLARFRCRIGHAYSEDSLLAEHSEALETALSAAHRALEEHTALCRRTAARLRRRGHTGAAARFERQAADALEHAALVQTTLRRLEAPPEPVEAAPAAQS